MSSILSGPIGPATQAKRGTMSAEDKTKLDAYPDTPATGAVETVTEANGLDLTDGDLSLAAAAADAAGAVTTGEQTFGGAKTLSGAILNGVTTVAEAVTALVRAAAASLVLRSSLGAGSTDRCVVIGSSEVDGTVHSSAKVVSFGTGIGGTYVERGWFRKSGTDGFGLAASLGLLSMDSSLGILISWNSASSLIIDGNGARISGNLQLNTSATARPTANAGNRGRLWYSRSAGGAADTVEICLKSAGDTYSWVTLGTG